MKRWIIGALVLGAVTGCNMPSMKDGRADAHKRWDHARAQVLCQVGVEHLRVGQLDRACKKALEALALNEDYTPARVLLGKVCIEQGHYRAAAAELARAQVNAPNSDEIVYLLGVAQEKDGCLDEALASYRRAHSLNEANLAAVTAAAEVLVLMGRTREAQLQLESYIHLAAEDPGVYELAGRLAMMQQEHAEAAKYYEQAADLDPGNLRYREVLAQAQFAAGEHAKAAGTLKDLSQSNQYKAPAWVYTMLGDCHMAMGRPIEARDAYQIASQQSPESAGAWANLAKAALALNDLPRAILSAKQALNLEAGRLDATLLLGYALLRNGQVDGALRLLPQAVARYPDNGTLRCLLGRAHAAAGNEAEAAQCYAAALKLEPDNQLAQALLAGPGPKRALLID